LDGLSRMRTPFESGHRWREQPLSNPTVSLGSTDGLVAVQWWADEDPRRGGPTNLQLLVLSSWVRRWRASCPQEDSGGRMILRFG
jgi:hypothetical protein